MFHSIASAPSLSQRSLGRVTVAFVAAAMLLAPLTAPESADAASTTPPVIRLGYDVYEGALSPNGDGSQDNVRIRFNLASRSDVIVTVRRNNTDRTVVYRKKLGRLSGGVHAWQWNGKNPRGKPVRDGRYSAIFVADQVARAGKTSRSAANVFVDTYFNTKWSPTLSADTVYPHTTLTQDSIVVNLNNTVDDPMTELGQVVFSVKDASGHVVATSRSFDYRPSDFPEGVPLEFRGTDFKNNYPLPAGTYRLRYAVRDAAGEPRPRQGRPGARVGQATGRGHRVGRRSAHHRVDDNPRPQAEAETRSPCHAAPWCPPRCIPSRARRASARPTPAEGTWSRPSLAAAAGRLTLDALTPQVAPRGLRSSWLSMRGKPTVAGESDTARLFSGGFSYSYPNSGPYVSSAAMPTRRSPRVSR